MQNHRAFLAALAGGLILGLSGCVSSKSTVGVENEWRQDPFSVVVGETTEQQVLDYLGPPSQVIPLKDRTVFYYVLEESRSKSLYTIIYNQTNTRITYDRAVFFFGEDGLLVEYALSTKELQPPKKKEDPS